MVKDQGQECGQSGGGSGNTTLYVQWALKGGQLSGPRLGCILGRCSGNSEGECEVP